MRLRDIKNGDILRFRQWDDMAREYGTSPHTIECRFSFISDMKYLCGKYVKVFSVISDYIGVRLLSNNEEVMWNISADMLENPDFLLFTYDEENKHG